MKEKHYFVSSSWPFSWKTEDDKSVELVFGKESIRSPPTLIFNFFLLKQNVFLQKYYSIKITSISNPSCLLKKSFGFSFSNFSSFL